MSFILKNLMYRFLLLLILLSSFNASESEDEIIIFFRPECYFFLQGKSEIVSFKIKRTTNNKQQLWWSCQISNSGEFVITLFFWGWSSIGYPPLPHSILSGFRSLVPTYILVGGNSVVQWEWNVLSKKSKEWPGQVSNVDLLTWSPSCWQTVLLVSFFQNC